MGRQPDQKEWVDSVQELTLLLGFFGVASATGLLLHGDAWGAVVVLIFLLFLQTLAVDAHNHEISHKGKK